ncbi:unnamed protein product, partial [Ectocarpus sp. 13 AM-2016]
VLGLLFALLRRSGTNVGIGTVYGALILGTARHPSLKDETFRMAI